MRVELEGALGLGLGFGCGSVNPSKAAYVSNFIDK